MKKTFLLFLVMVTGVFAQSRPPIDKLTNLRDVQSGTPATGDVLRWNGTQWNRVKGTYVDLSGNLLPNDMPVNLPSGSTVGSVPIGASGETTTLPAGKTLVVDSNNSIGNDSTATRGRVDLPYATFAKALTDAQNGDTIELRPGIYGFPTTTKIVNGLSIHGAGQGLTTIRNSTTTLGSTDQQPLLQLIGDNNEVSELTMDGYRSSLSSVNNTTVAIRIDGNNCRYFHVRATSFQGGTWESFTLVMLGADNVIDSCTVDDFSGFGTLISILQSARGKITNNRVYAPNATAAYGTGNATDLTVEGNESYGAAVGFNRDSGILNGLTLRNNGFYDSSSSGVRVTSYNGGGDAVANVHVTDNTITRATVGDGWPSIIVAGAAGTVTNAEVSRNNLRYYGAGSVTGLVVSSATGGEIFDNTQGTNMRADVGSAWGSANASVALRDNLQADATPMLQTDGTPIPGNVITARIGTNYVSTSSLAFTASAETDLVQSNGANAVITLPAIGTGLSQVRPNKTITVQNNFGGGSATVKNAAGVTLGTVLSSSPVVFRAVSGSPDNWKPSYQATNTPLVLGQNASAAGTFTTALTLQSGQAFTFGNGGTTWFQLKNSSGTELFGIYTKANTPVAQQAGDVAAGLVAEGWMATGATYDATKLTGVTSVVNGGTGTATPGLIAGAGILVTGSFPDQTITNTGGGGGGGGGDALVANSLAQFSATTSDQLAVVMSDEVGTGGKLVFNKGPVINDAAGTSKASANFAIRKLVGASGLTSGVGAGPITWGDGTLNVSGLNGDGSLLIDVSNADNGSNQIVFTGVNSAQNPFAVDGNGTLRLADDDANVAFMTLSNGYINFGNATVGSTGYGVRDNSAMEYKDSGGTWKPFNSASSLSSGTVAIARLPTGILSTTVALGNHTHTSTSAPSFGSTITPLYSGKTRTIANYTATSDVTTVASPSGSPTDGETLELNILLSGGAWTITGWNAIYALGDNTPAIPTTSGKMFTLLFEYSTLKTKWVLRAVSDTY